MHNETAGNGAGIPAEVQDDAAHPAACENCATPLEHLVVALYSHAFLLLVLLALFLLSAMENIGVPGWLRGPGYAVVWIWTPVHLWKMQRRVYGGGWLSNLLRYPVIGCTCFVLVSLAIAYAVLIGISS